jgi:hypothetical protein
VYYLNGKGCFHLLRVVINGFKFKWVNANVHSTSYCEYSKQESVSGLEDMMTYHRVNQNTNIVTKRMHYFLVSKMEDDRKESNVYISSRYDTDFELVFMHAEQIDNCKAARIYSLS